MIRPLDGSGLVPLSDMADPSERPDENSARFEKALLQATGFECNSLGLCSQMLTAADNAWVEVVAVAEQLRDPALPKEKRELLLKNLQENWLSFQRQIAPMARIMHDQLSDESVPGQTQAPSEPDRPRIGRRHCRPAGV